ncbi:putative lipid II flippase FtsW [Advenella sp. RU8]|uniref:putative lipid II flippase FtsW n=1 Tax=Advenella sp. RU8 TaxID=3399575 RepID=UPI003AAAD00E
MSVLGELRSSVSAVKPGRTTMRNYDLLLGVAVSTLLLFGLIMVFSASIALADGPKYANLGRYYFVLRHAIYIAIGIFLFSLTVAVPMSFWEKYAFRIFLFASVLLVLVLVPFIGREVNGASRWLPIGPVNFQPSELMKVAMLLFAADYTVRKQKYMQNLARGFAPMAVALIMVAVLLLLEPDLGAFMVTVAITVGILFLGGINLGLFVAAIGALVVFFVLMIILAPWRLGRIMAYLEPFHESNVQSSAYQLVHSLIAIGRGEWFGVGLGSSIEKLHYLPEAHTDFIMAVVGEELGFVGILFVIVLFFIIVKKSFEIGRSAIAMDREFNGLVAQGVGIWFGVQAFINLGVCLGLLPTKGLTLPLVSYGGSSIVMNLIAIAMLMRVDYEVRQMMRGQHVSNENKRSY